MDIRLHLAQQKLQATIRTSPVFLNHLYFYIKYMLANGYKRERPSCYCGLLREGSRTRREWRGYFKVCSTYIYIHKYGLKSVFFKKKKKGGHKVSVCTSIMELGTGALCSLGSQGAHSWKSLLMSLNSYILSQQRI